MSDWLKSIKSNHWKPSEEQMKTLAEWLKNHQYDGDSRYCYPIFNHYITTLKTFDMTQEEKYSIEKEGYKWVVDYSVYPEQGYYIKREKKDYKTKQLWKDLT